MSPPWIWGVGVCGGKDNKHPVPAPHAPQHPQLIAIAGPPFLGEVGLLARVRGRAWIDTGSCMTQRPGEQGGT
jgi:hypothetical protein